MEQDRLIVPTLLGFHDVFRTAIKNNSQAFLFHPQDVQYQWEDGRLLRGAALLSSEEVKRLAGDVTVNLPIEDSVLIYGLFSYVASRKGLVSRSTFDIGITDISRFFGVTMGKTGFQLIEKLQALQSVYGVWVDSGEVCPLLTVDRIGTKIRLSSPFMHNVLKAMIAISSTLDLGMPYYYTELAHANLVAERNKVAALIVIELVRLIVTTGGRHQPKIQLSTLEKYVPQLRVIRESCQANKLKNRDLKRIFSRVYPLLESKTELHRTFRDFSTNKFIPKVDQFHMNIVVSHRGYQPTYGGGLT